MTQGTRIELAPGVREAMGREAERKFPKESGGVLLGYLAPEEKGRVQVLEQIGPGPRAVHRSHRFEPDGKWQAKKIAMAYEKSGRIATYLGDWHSHPRGVGWPSRLDRSTARTIARSPEARAPHPLILILFGSPGRWEIAAFRRARWRLRPVEVLATEAA
jgi:integrative and conjugative element protein (TIGR02256 family)